MFMHKDREMRKITIWNKMDFWGKETFRKNQKGKTTPNILARVKSEQFNVNKTAAALFLTDHAG